MCWMSRFWIGFGLLAVASGGPGANAYALPSMVWVGSASSGVWERTATLPGSSLAALAEDGFGVAVATEKTTGRGLGSDPARRLPISQLQPFFAHNRPTGVLVASYADDEAGMVIYIPERDVWDALSPSEAEERFWVVLDASAFLITQMGRKFMTTEAEVEGTPTLLTFALPAAGRDGPMDVFLLADAAPNGEVDAWSPFSLDMMSTEPPEAFLQGWSPEQDRLVDEGYVLLEAGRSAESPYLSSTPVFGAATPDGLFDVWVHPAFSEIELSATRDALLDGVQLWETEPLVPIEEVSLNF